MWLTKKWITFERHSAFRTTARRVALHTIAHRAKVFLHRLTRLRRVNTRCVIRKMIIATGMPGPVALSATFHSMTVRCEATCSEGVTPVAAESDREAAIYCSVVGLPVSANSLSRLSCSLSMLSTAGAILSNPPTTNPPTLYES